MENIKGALQSGQTAAAEWDVLNCKNKRMVDDFVKSGKTQVNVGRQIGVKMVEYVD